MHVQVEDEDMLCWIGLGNGSMADVTVDLPAVLSGDSGYDLQAGPRSRIPRSE